MRFAILIFAMLMPRDRGATVPLTYMVTKLVSQPQHSERTVSPLIRLTFIQFNLIRIYRKS